MKPITLALAAGTVCGVLITAAVYSDGDSPAAQAQSPGATATDSAYGTAQSSAQLTPIQPVRASRTQAPLDLTPEELANIRAYRVASQSVVNITTSTVQFDRMFGQPIEGSGAGSGSILDKQGHVLTNHHVIDGARQIEVTLASGKNYEAQLIGADAEYDIAVLKINAPKDELFPIKLGKSDALLVGQKAYAVGNPFGLEGSLTVGIVSSLNRSVPSRVGGRAMTGMVQTDAAMNPGNSGGPLLNSRAEMIGMNVAIASKVGQNSGIGFAIPVDRIRRFLPELIEHGKVIRAYHGIVTLMETPEGLKIAKVSRGGPADRAGLRGFRLVRVERREGPVLYTQTRIDRDHADTILAINDQEVSTHTEFLEIMDRFKPGDTVTFTVLRDGSQQQIALQLGAA